MRARDEALALTVANRIEDRPQDACAAWLEARGIVCGKPASRPWLCARHVTVADRRWEKQVEKERARREKAVREAEAKRPRREARLAKVEARLDQIDPFRRGGGDTAVVNTPLRTRIPSDSRIEELAALHREAKTLRQQLGRTA